MLLFLSSPCKEGGEALSSLLESCQCTDSQTFQDICSLFGGEVLRCLDEKLPYHSTLILSVITTEYHYQHLLIVRSSDHHKQVVRSWYWLWQQTVHDYDTLIFTPLHVPIVSIFPPLLLAEFCSPLVSILTETINDSDRETRNIVWLKYFLKNGSLGISLGCIIPQGCCTRR